MSLAHASPTDTLLHAFAEALVQLRMRQHHSCSRMVRACMGLTACLFQGRLPYQQFSTRRTQSG